MAAARLRKSLGRPLRAYRGRGVTGWDLLLWALPGILLPLAISALLIMNRYNGYAQMGGDSTPGDRFWAGLAVLTLLITSILSLRRFATARTAVILHQNGLRLRHVPHAPPTVRWNQIRSIRTAGTRHHLFGIPLRDSIRTTIQLADGTTFHLPEHILNSADLVHQIHTRIRPALKHASQQALLQGQPLPFGPITLHPTAIEIGDQSFPWNTIERIRVHEGRLSIDIVQHPPIVLDPGDIPNLPHFLQLAKKAALVASRSP